MKTIIFSISALVAGAAVAAPLWFGNETSNQLQTAINDFRTAPSTPPWIKVRIDDYQQGWLSSTAQTTFTFDVNELDPQAGKIAPAFDIVMKHTITHGPFADSKLISAIIESELVVPAEAKPVVSHYFGNTSPLSQRTVVDLEGNSSTSVMIPSYTGRDHENKTDIDWQGLTASYQGQWGSGTGNVNLEMPRLSMKNEQITVQFDAFQVEADLRPSTIDMPLGKGSITLKEFTADSAVQPGFTMKGLKITGDSSQSGDLITSSETVSFDTLEVAPILAVGPGEISLEMSNLNVNVLGKLEQRFQELEQSGLPPDQMGPAFGMALMEFAPELLQSSPQLNISKANLSTEMGDIATSLLINFDGEGDFNLQDPNSLTPRLTIDVKASAPEVLVNMASQVQARTQVMKVAAQSDQTLDAEQLAQQIAAASEQQLEQLEKMNFIVRNDDMYSSHVRFEKGSLTLNGQPANQLLGMLPGAQTDTDF